MGLSGVQVVALRRVTDSRLQSGGRRELGGTSPVNVCKVGFYRKKPGKPSLGLFGTLSLQTLTTRDNQWVLIEVG